MRVLFLSLLLLPFFSFAQECKLKKEKDEFTQQPKLSTGFMKFAHEKGGLSLNMVADAKEVKLLFSFGQGICFDDQSTAVFSFDSTRTKSSQRNSTAMNCDGIFTIIFRNSTTTPGALQKMSTHFVSSITVTGTAKQKMEIVLTQEQKNQLRQKATCLINESKALIKPS
jgi:hypothetical protein